MKAINNERRHTQRKQQLNYNVTKKARCRPPNSPITFRVSTYATCSRRTAIITKDSGGICKGCRYKQYFISFRHNISKGRVEFWICRYCFDKNKINYFQLVVMLTYTTLSWSTQATKIFGEDGHVAIIHRNTRSQSR